MQKAGISHATVAAAMGLNRGTVTAKINETRNITVDDARFIRDTFFSGLTLDYLFASDKSVRARSDNRKSKKMLWVEKHKDEWPNADAYWDVKNERLFQVWRAMIGRCGNATGYKDVKVCDEWHDYFAFSEWAYANGYDENAPYGECTIDRINPFGDYRPSNCRWTDMKTQARNKRKNWKHKQKTSARS